MEFVYEPALRAHMERTGRRNIVIEVVIPRNSELEIAELYVHFLDDRMTRVFKERYHYRGVPAELGEVLLPSYRLAYAPTVTLGLKKILWFHTLTQTGVSF